MSLIRRAKRFAEERHGEINQIRKYTGEPYITHPAAVAKIVASVKHTDEMIAASWLHDTVEDTRATTEDIYDLFGSEVGYLVQCVTDVSKLSDGNRAVRKALDRNHIAQASAGAQTIKLADLIHNTLSIVEHGGDFAKIYLAEKRLLLDVLRDGDKDLWARAYWLARQGDVGE
ncbi:MAG: HD domain-containing protein [Piscirickettsiaceae bacterium]|nr:HD domain-containing protein [Piscirickettsiaceae bacterium]